MRIGPLNLPDKLVKAQAAGDLVVFAGAGISRPPPSGLPLFAGLAGQIATGVVKARAGNEPDERHLGRLAEAGVDVHARSAQILLAPASQPTPLHELLFELFDRHPVRIVTTNFDAHFDWVLAKSAPGLPVYVAPALPLGDRFEGLVYLHGSARRAPSDCVLTDADFGRAYLLEGWARRFLVALFSRYTVAFVGYRHSDVVVSYLARAIPPERMQRRFAFAMDNEPGDWEFLGVERISYPPTNGPNEHQALTDGIEKWVGLIGRGLLGNAQRVRELAAAPPPPPGEDADFLIWALNDSALRHAFAGQVTDPSWLTWLDQRHLLDPLFTPHAVPTDSDQEFEIWLAREFHGDEAEHLFAAIQRHNGLLNPGLIWRLIRLLTSGKPKEPKPDALGRWVAFFTTQDLSAIRTEWWEQLLDACSWLRDPDPFLLLFEALTKPRLRLAERWAGLSEWRGDARLIDFEVSVGEKRRPELSRIWADWSTRHLPALAGRVLPIIESNLAGAYRLLRSAHEDSAEGGDFFSVRRQSIEAGDSGSARSALDCLVDAARDLLSHLLETHPPQGAALIDRWFASGTTLLRRLAITGAAKRRGLSADQRLDWLLDEGLLYEHKTDVFWFLRRIYPPASDAARERVLARCRVGPSSGMWSRVSPEDRAYEIYNLLVWLADIAPDCPRTRAALAEVQAEHPEWSPRTEPDVGFSSSGMIDPDVPLDVDVEALAGAAPDPFLKELAAAPADPFHPRSRDRYVATIAKAVAAKPDWGIDVLEALSRVQVPECGLWSRVCFAWRQAHPTESQWEKILRFALGREGPQDFLEAFVDVLDPGRQREQRGIPERLIGEAEEVAYHIWDCALSGVPQEQRQPEDWFHEAINRPAGRIAEFWFFRLAERRTAAGDQWAGIPADIADTIRTLITETGMAGVYARVVMASHLVHWVAWDATFARAHLYPLLAWEENQLRARQCWQGFLWGQRWNRLLVDDLLAHLEGVLDHAGDQPERLQELLGWHVAYLVLVGLDDEARNGWLQNAIHRLPETSRVHFAHVVAQSLEAEDRSTREGHWQRWIGGYWRSRADGIPLPIALGEASAMAGWASRVGRFFPEAVDLVIRMGGSCLAADWDLPERLLEKGLIREFPESAARLIVPFLQSRPHDRLPPEVLLRVWTEFEPLQIEAGTRRDLQEALVRAWACFEKMDSKRGEFV